MKTEIKKLLKQLVSNARMVQVEFDHTPLSYDGLNRTAIQKAARKERQTLREIGKLLRIKFSMEELELIQTVY